MRVATVSLFSSSDARTGVVAAQPTLRICASSTNDLIQAVADVSGASSVVRYKYTNQLLYDYNVVGGLVQVR